MLSSTSSSEQIAARRAMAILLGLLAPTRGSITIDGLSPRDAVRRGDVIGYLPQRPRVPQNFPINVRQIARSKGMGH